MIRPNENKNFLLGFACRINIGQHLELVLLQHPGSPLKASLTSSCAACSEAVEVLLRNKAVLERVGAADGKEAESGGASLKGRQYAWSKHGGPVKAWACVREAAKWPAS